MSFTNSTPNYGLPQYIGTDKPTYLGDMNTAYSTIDTQMKNNADAASAAITTANAAASAATTAATNATTAINTANNAASEAASATSAAASATATANTADTNAAAALRASAGNSIENLAPAYDPTLTYNVGDLVTYIDKNNSGKLYKCIVAVSTPEAFNINKWDDLTTSEAYAHKSKILATAVGDGVKTFKDLINEFASILNSMDLLTIRRTSIVFCNNLANPSEATYFKAYRFCLFSGNSYKYDTAMTYNVNFQPASIVIHKTTPATSSMIAGVVGNTNTFTEDSNAVTTDGEGMYLILD